jgi:hypothetical protein
MCLSFILGEWAACADCIHIDTLPNMQAFAGVLASNENIHHPNAEFQIINHPGNQAPSHQNTTWALLSCNQTQEHVLLTSGTCSCLCQAAGCLRWALQPSTKSHSLLLAALTTASASASLLQPPLLH